MSLFQVTKKQESGEGIVLRTFTGNIVSFKTSYSEALPEPFGEIHCKANIVASQASGTPTPSTPLPISGYSSANITRCGVNLFDNDFSHYRKPVNYYIKNVPLEIGKTYTLKATLKSGGTAVSGCYFGVAAHGEQYSEFLPDLYPCVKTDGTTATSTLNVSSSWTSPKLVCYVSNETQFNSIFENYDITLVEGSTANYAPYNGDTVTIAFGQTVYGGVLDVTRGKLHVTWGSVDLGEYNYTTSNYRFNTLIRLPNAILGNSDHCLCSNYKSNIGAANRTADKSCCLANNGYVYIYDTTFSGDETAFKTAMSGVLFAYELATPFDIDLTPVTQINALLRVNNVFNDTNGDTEVTCLI